MSKKKSPPQFNPAALDELASGVDEKTVAPYLSSAEIYRRLGKPGQRKERVFYDAQGGPDADLWNKGSKNFKERRRAAMNKKGEERWVEATVELAPRERSKRNKNVGSEPGEREAVGLRIIGGALRGTKLEYGGDRRVRPMKDRVREAIFNLLGETPKGKRAIDLFAGTGALAFEALSRGAVAATMIEVHFPTARVTRRNIATLEKKSPGLSSKIELLTTDVYFWARRLAATDSDQPTSPVETSSRAALPRDVPWLVFCSPPYDFWVDRKDETLNLLRVLRDRAPQGSAFAIEADDRFDFDELKTLDVELPPKKRRSYPPAEVAIFFV